MLSQLLQLPPRDCLIRNLSGGQQRRVSFAAALIHKPELLILDEPTVGLDPILRDNIWNHLVQLTQEEGVSIIITTHYIEEAKQANKIGLLRSGQLLAEASPNQLLTKFHCDTLEEAFLTLSQQQSDNQQRQGFTDINLDYNTSKTEHNWIPTDNQDDCIYNNNEKYNMQQPWRETKEETQRKPRKLQALLIKNFLQFIRHPGGILFALVLPVVQVTFFFQAIGQDPKGLSIGIVNEEAGNCDFERNFGQIIYHPENFECNYIDLSCTFLRGFNESIVDKIYYDDLKSAYRAARNGKIAGTMFFASNFSKSLQLRQDDITSASEQMISDGQIQVSLDMSNRQLGMHLERKLLERFFEVYEEIVQSCGISKKFSHMPLNFENPVFGSKDNKYSTFMAPGFILTMIFFLATSVSSSIIITDRHEGIWDRSLVQGVSTAEILISHLCTQLMVVLIQSSVTLLTSFLHPDFVCKGSLIAVIMMVIFMGINGMCYGFLISVLCSNHTVANYVSTGSFYPVILLCGAIWPLEGMPQFLRWFSFTLPTTIPSLALRGLLEKGYSYKDPDVYNGFLVISGWTICLIILCLYCIKSKKA